MLMAIDVGNTNMVFGLLDGERLVGSFRLMTDANRTSDEIGLTVCEYFRRFDLTMDQVTDIIIALSLIHILRCRRRMLVVDIGGRRNIKK